MTSNHEVEEGDNLGHYHITLDSRAVLPSTPQITSPRTSGNRSRKAIKAYDNRV